VEDEISYAPMRRLMKEAGAERVGEDAAQELGRALERIGIIVSKEALDFALHAGRKTVKAEDVRIAVKKILR